MRLLCPEFGCCATERVVVVIVVVVVVDSEYVSNNVCGFQCPVDDSLIKVTAEFHCCSLYMFPYSYFVNRF